MSDIATAKRLNSNAIVALVEYIGMLEPGMPREEAENLARGTLAILVDWSCGGEQLPDAVREYLALSPWKDKR